MATNGVYTNGSSGSSWGAFDATGQPRDLISLDDLDPGVVERAQGLGPQGRYGTAAQMDAVLDHYMDTLSPRWGEIQEEISKYRDSIYEIRRNPTGPLPQRGGPELRMAPEEFIEMWEDVIFDLEREAIDELMDVVDFLKKEHPSRLKEFVPDYLIPSLEEQARIYTWSQEVAASNRLNPGDRLEKIRLSLAQTPEEARASSIIDSVYDEAPAPRAAPRAPAPSVAGRAARAVGVGLGAAGLGYGAKQVYRGYERGGATGAAAEAVRQTLNPLVPGGRAAQAALDLWEKKQAEGKGIPDKAFDELAESEREWEAKWDAGEPGGRTASELAMGAMRADRGGIAGAAGALRETDDEALAQSLAPEERPAATEQALPWDVYSPYDYPLTTDR